MNTVLRTISISPDLDKRIDEKRGQLKRSTYISNMIEFGMSCEEKK